MGGIGLKLARWLAVRGARHIALLGRRAPSDAAREQIAAMESLGASIRVFSADVSQEGQVASALQTIAAEMPQLRGVFHLAGVNAGILLADLTPERFESVMGPKVGGAWNLHSCLRDTPLDYFVLFSSMTAVAGQHGLGAYAAGNAYLDALARYRQARGLPALSIQWGMWSQLGMINEERVQGGVRDYCEQGMVLAFRGSRARRTGANHGPQPVQR